MFKHAIPSVSGRNVGLEGDTQDVGEQTDVQGFTGEVNLQQGVRIQTYMQGLTGEVKLRQKCREHQFKVNPFY